jgi:hypothetical protein
MSARTPMTPEQLRNNYEYKVVRRAIMKEFPWIVDVTFNEDETNEYNIIFLDFVVDRDKVKELTDFSFPDYAVGRIEKGYYYKGLYPSLIFNMSYTEGKNTITDHMEDLMDKIHDSPALPDELKLPSGRSFKPSSFIVNPDGPEY